MAFLEPQPRSRSFVAAANAGGQQSEDDEERWVGWVQQSLKEQTSEALGAAAKVFNVPRSLLDTKPEAYAPHVFALGPYHHARPELKDMERFKLAAAKRVETLFTGDRKMEHLKDRFMVGSLELKIRSMYHRFLYLNGTTLAWMMAIDACFLLDFIENSHRQHVAATDAVSSTTNCFNAIVRDAMMLENQIPLFVFAKTLEFRHATHHESAKALHAIADRFVKAVCPIKIENRHIGDVSKHAHLLELMYHFLVPDAEFVAVEDGSVSSGGDQDEQPAATEVEGELSHDEVDIETTQLTTTQFQDEGYVKVKQVCLQVSRLDIAPVRFVKQNLISRPMAMASSLSGKIARKAPALAALLPMLVKAVQSVDVEAQLNGAGGDEARGGAAAADAPRADEIRVPSVEQLARCGVRFVETREGIAGIAFYPATATLRLPAITLDANTEVVLRNLVAYEAVAVRGPLVLARYTELMNGIIDTSKDVKVLRRSGVLKNHMKSGKEAAGMWNGMARATRISKVPRIDAVIAAVNAHRSRSAAVRAQKLLKKYVFRSWKMLTLLASVGLLVMTALQTFCTAYPCGTHWFDALALPGAGGDDPPAR